jgi:hypothetical protein
VRHISIFALSKALASGVAGVGDVYDVPPEDSARTGCRHSHGQLARRHAQSRLNGALAQYWHAAHSGANADLDKESAMHPTIQTQIMKARTTGAHRTADQARLAHLEDAMPVSTQPGRTRPNSAPAYYLGRPASFWITVSTRRASAPAACRPAA